jgi:hypothetical protein
VEYGFRLLCDRDWSTRRMLRSPTIMLFTAEEMVTSKVSFAPATSARTLDALSHFSRVMESLFLDR